MSKPESEGVDASVFFGLDAALTRMGAAFAACADALMSGLKLAVEGERRYAHVIVCIRAGYAADITDEEALRVLWKRYGHDAMALSAALGDWYTARAHRDLNELRNRLGNPIIRTLTHIDASRIATGAITADLPPNHVPHLHYQKPQRSPQGREREDAHE